MRMAKRWWLVSVVAALFLLLVACDQTVTPGLGKQDYGRGAQYQVEISLNCTSLQNCEEAGLPPGVGFGVWLWLALNRDGTGDYAGADCGHRVQGESGAIGDRGDLRWYDDGTHLVITGVALFGGAVPVTINVPDTIGHHVLQGYEVFPDFPFAVGNTQVQVAP